MAGTEESLSATESKLAETEESLSAMKSKVTKAHHVNTSLGLKASTGSTWMMRMIVGWWSKEEIHRAVRQWHCCLSAGLAETNAVKSNALMSRMKDGAVQMLVLSQTLRSTKVAYGAVLRWQQEKSRDKFQDEKHAADAARIRLGETLTVTMRSLEAAACDAQLQLRELEAACLEDRRAASEDKQIAEEHQMRVVVHWHQNRTSLKQSVLTGLGMILCSWSKRAQMHLLNTWYLQTLRSMVSPANAPGLGSANATETGIEPFMPCLVVLSSAGLGSASAIAHFRGVNRQFEDLLHQSRDLHQRHSRCSRQWAEQQAQIKVQMGMLTDQTGRMELLVGTHLEALVRHIGTTRAHAVLQTSFALRRWGQCSCRGAFGPWVHNWQRAVHLRDASRFAAVQFLNTFLTSRKATAVTLVSIWRASAVIQGTKECLRSQASRINVLLTQLNRVKDIEGRERAVTIIEKVKS